MMSKAYISCDMEGCTGVVNIEFCSPDGKYYKEGKAYMTGDLNAVIAGLQNAGVETILVNDSHWEMTNLRIEDLPEGVDLISGGTKVDSMVEGLDSSFEAVLFVGYHPMWGEERGVNAHTFSGSIMEVSINRKPVGESAIMGFVAGYYGVPVILVSGDTVLREEIRALSGDIHFVTTKSGITKASAHL